MPPVVYIDTSIVRDGKLDECNVAVRHMARFIEEKMPRVTSYGVFFDDDRRQMTVVALRRGLRSVNAAQQALPASLTRMVAGTLLRPDPPPLNQTRSPRLDQSEVPS